MKSFCLKLVAVLFLPICLWAKPQKTPAAAPQMPSAPAGERIVFREAHYEGRVTESEARFVADLKVDSAAKQETAAVVFDGDIAVLPPKLPSALRLEREGTQYRIVASKPGQYEFKLEFVAKIARAEPWNQIALKCPPAAIASVTVQAAGTDVDLQLLNGTVVGAVQSNGAAKVTGFLGADQTLALRWSRGGGKGDVAHKAVVTSETTCTAQITPTVIKYVTHVRYEILQGKLPSVSFSLPASHALTRIVGEQIRDWEINAASQNAEGAKTGQTLTVKFIKPLEKQYELTLFSEQSVESSPATASLQPPQPLEVERESGSFTISAEDMVAEIDSASGLRRVNAPSGAFASYHFNARPAVVAVKMKRVEPVISATGQNYARVGEKSCTVLHVLSLEVEKAGIYSLELQPQAGFVVADVRGEGVEDWKMMGKVLRIGFSNRVLGSRKIEVQLEQPLKTFPEQITVEPLRVLGAARESSLLGAAAAPGIQLKTAEMVGLREIPGKELQARAALNGQSAGNSEELLAYVADQADWKLTLATERLSARVVADVFNLVTIGDGILGGSATIRYGLINQGVQQFEVAVPSAWKNVEFTGQNIRRKEQKTPGVWTVELQEKAWNGYTLVVTYDYQFDPTGATLPIAGIHALGVERETGSVAVTTAASLKLNANKVSDSLRRIDEGELATADRALVTRAVLLAYQYSDPKYELSVDAKRYGELPLLSAVADRIQLTTVLTDAGEMLTQASFMVKNNDKQFQKFKLPNRADFWNCYVNGQAVKAERDNDWLMVPLPRGANRDQAFAVDIVYAEKKGKLAGAFSRPLQFVAPQTDVPNTYAEWQLYAPQAFRLSGFGGNMMVARGTTYDLRDAWQQFTNFYYEFLREAGFGLFMLGTVAVLMVTLIGSAVRRGWNGVLSVLVVFGIVAVLAAMLLPALSRAKSRAQRINATNNLKQIGLAMKTFALDNGGRFPNSYEEMINELSTEKVTIDPESGQRFIYLGAGLIESNIQPDSVVAFSPTDMGGARNVLFADGSVQQMSGSKFAELERRGWIIQITAQQLAQNQQAAAVRTAQLEPAQPAMANATPGNGPIGRAGVGGIRSIHIEIPHEGQAFTFTKVLNPSRDPLAVNLRIMKWHTFQTAQMICQVVAFLMGLVVWFWQWRGARKSFVLTFALALMLGAVISLLLAWRLLHTVLIWTAPVVLLVVVGWLTWKFWPRSGPAAASEPARFEPGIPPAIAGVLLVLSLAMGANAEEVGKNTQTISATEGNKGNVAVPNSEKVSIISASYVGTVNEQIAQMEATLQLTTTEANEKVPLFGEDVAVEQFAAKPGHAKLLRDGKGVAVIVPRRGESTLHLKLLVKLGGDVTKRQLAFNIPAALASQLALMIEQPEAAVEFPNAISMKLASVKEQTRVEVIIGSAGRVELFWTPRVKRASETAANVICQNVALASFGNGVLNTRSMLEFQITQGEMQRARVGLPAGHRVLRVEGDAIRTWEVKTENSEQALFVELLKGVAASYRLTLETEKPLEHLPALVKTEIPHALDVKRETGLVGLRSEEDLELTVEQSRDLSRVDAEEFARASGEKSAGVMNAFRFLKTDFDLQARVSPMQPQIEAVARNQIRISGDQINLSARMDYTIKRAGVFTLQVVVPTGFRVEKVNGNNILQWVEKAAANGSAGSGSRLIEVTLKERTAGAYSLGIEMVQNLKELPNPLAIAGVHPLGVEKLTGFILVSSEAGVAIKPGNFEGLSEIPPTAVPGNESNLSSSALAYKYLAGDGMANPAWTLAIVTESLESWVRTEIVNTITLGEAVISGRAMARFDIQNAPVKELRLKIPAAFQNVEISGANIRRRDQQGEIWKVEFQNKVGGAQTLTVTWEQPRAGRTNLLELAGVSAVGVERETGILAVVAHAPIQVSEQNAAELKAIDLREMPEWAGRPDDATVLAYRYLRPGYRLLVESKRFEEAEVLQALVDNFNLTTVVADDGQVMTEMSLAMRNNGRQHLEIAMPPGATVWSAFVAGQAVRPSVREGKLLLPLEHPSADDAPFTVELTYVGTNRFPQKRGAFELVSPRLDAPLKSARWELFLPPDYRYSDFSGTMVRETASTATEASIFSRYAYSQQESQNKDVMFKAWKSEVSSAQKQLSSGNVKEALADYSRARAQKGKYTLETDQETKKLEKDLNSAQGSNLIAAQNSFTVNNSGNGAGAGNAIRYDKAAAEAQWAKLQQAQELGVAQVQPIHVNLPTRGMRHAFTQVLQTELNKAMTIRLVAVNEKGGNWPKTAGMGVLAFVALWVAVGLVAKRGRTVQS